MDLRPGFHNRGHHISLKIRSLLTSLPQAQSEFDKAAQNIEFWIEYVLREHISKGGRELISWLSALIHTYIYLYNVAAFNAR